MGDVTFSAGALTIIGALGGLLVGAISLLFRALMTSKDGALKDMTGQRDSNQKLAAQAISALELAANRARRARGEPPFQAIPGVIPEHNSPTTPDQIDTAEFQTLLARGTAAARDLSLPPLHMMPSDVDVSGKDEDSGDVGMPNVLVVAEGMDVRLRIGEAVTITAEETPPTEEAASTEATTP